MERRRSNLFRTAQLKVAITTTKITEREKQILKGNLRSDRYCNRTLLPGPSPNAGWHGSLGTRARVRVVSLPTPLVLARQNGRHVFNMYYWHKLSVSRAFVETVVRGCGACIVRYTRNFLSFVYGHIHTHRYRYTRVHTRVRTRVPTPSRVDTW